MTPIRSLVLAAALVATALPALAQTPAPDAAPAATGATAGAAETPVPDAGLKKTPPALRTHHHVRHVRAHSTTPTTPPAKAS